MALAGALCLTLHAVTGFTNRSLRAHVAGLLGSPYSANQMSYDLARLRLHGLIRRLDRRHCYVITPQGRRFAVFYTKFGNRVVAPLFAADQPNSPAPLRRALATIRAIPRIHDLRRTSGRMKVHDNVTTHGNGVALVSCPLETVK